MRSLYLRALIAGAYATSAALPVAANMQVRVTETRDAGPQTADDAPLVQSAAEALDQDAQEYARNVGVPMDEAKRRLQAQRDSVAATNRIRETYGTRFVGIAIEHQPNYRIVVLLTGDAPVAAETINAGGMNVPIVFRTGALATEAQLVSALKQHQAAIRSLLPATQGLAIDPKTGELVVIVNAAGAAATAAVGRDAELETLTGVPVRVRALAGEARNFDVRGGSRMEANDRNGARFYCTTGFSVRESSGRTGVVTAAHCPEISGTYYNPNMTQIPLSFVNQWGYGSQDVQIHVSSYVESPEFYVNTAKTSVRRPVGQYTRLATRAGDNACHRGETTGASCSFVEYIYYQPSHSDCGGYCEPTWITVTGPNCAGGDSGGPVYDLGLARGILKGGYTNPQGACEFYWYMSLDYLPAGWSLLS